MIILRKSELTANAILYIQSAYTNTIDTWDIDEDVLEEMGEDIVVSKLYYTVD